jgi:putative ATPase
MARRRPVDHGPTLLDAAAERGALGGPPAPLADRMRPRTLAEVVGQKRLLAPGSLLTEAIAADRLPSLILWGPPGSGKTTLAHVVSRSTQAEFVPFSAVLGGVAELREIIAAAKDRRAYAGRRTILFVDEIHRFNKAQQDAFLPHVENGTVTLIGATTENPSFAVNAAVLSRARVLRLEELTDADIETLLRRAATDTERGLGAPGVAVEDAAFSDMARRARGDARRALGLLEAATSLLGAQGGRIDPDLVERAAGEDTLLYDKHGEEHYNVTSAFIKSMRGSDPDAAIYYLMRMLDAGDDPLFLLRRMIIFASEDVGNADPRALDVAVTADQAFRRLGMPEGLYPLSHACLYLASCPKSNSVGRAFTAARAAIEARGALPVPKKLRNAGTRLMKDEGYGEGYQYAHDFEGHVVPGESYLPDALVGSRFYEPSDQGLEQRIAERLARIRRGRDDDR